MKWYVVTPEYERYPAGETDPPEYGADVVDVEAATQREALVLGVRELRRTRSHWLRDHDGNPFSGLTADTFDDECTNHNFAPHCPTCSGECMESGCRHCEMSFEPESACRNCGIPEPA